MNPAPHPHHAALSAAVVRLQVALPHPHRALAEPPRPRAAGLAGAVAAGNRVSAWRGQRCGRLLLDAEVVRQRSDACEAVREQLVAEQALGKRMLLHSFDVATAKRADAVCFYGLTEPVRRIADEEEDVSMFEALA